MNRLRRVRFAVASLSLGLVLACRPIVLGAPGTPDAEMKPSSEGGAGGMSTLGGVSVVGGASPVGSWQGIAGRQAGSSGATSTSTAGMAGAPDSPCAEHPVRLSGRVLSARGVPVAGVSVALAGDATALTVSDADGQYAFEALCPGSYQLMPSGAGLQFCGGGAVDTKVDRDLTEDFTSSEGDCPSPAIDQRLLVIIYDPLVPGASGQVQRLSAQAGFEDPASLVDRTIRALNSASGDHVRLRLIEEKTVDQFPLASDGFQYSPSGYGACLADPTRCHSPERADYPALIHAQGVCDAVDSGSVDEVWLLGAPHLGFVPLHRLAADCRRGADLVGLGYQLGLAGALGDFQARSEDALAEVFGLAFANVAGNTFQAFVQVQSQSPGATASGCGNVRFAPNAPIQGRFDELAPVPSYCDAFFDSPPPQQASPVTEPTGCSAWWCTEQGFRRYWFSHLPRGRGFDERGKLADFWRYLLSPDDRLAQKPIICSSSYAQGWCDQISDGKHGECNVGEWATASQMTGWVELQLPNQVPITHVQLYDRACAERVLSGHLEFSDGSSSVTFGPLEDTGQEPTVVTFAQRLVESVRVVIDQSEGGPNPGFGEISVE